MTGELVSIAADTKTLVVKTGADKEMTFTYSDQTEIMGADKGAAGLATAKGSMVTVHYTVRGTTNVAAKIEVKSEEVGFGRRAGQPQDRPVQLCVPACALSVTIGNAAESRRVSRRKKRPKYARRRQNPARCGDDERGLRPNSESRRFASSEKPLMNRGACRAAKVRGDMSTFK